MQGSHDSGTVRVLQIKHSDEPAISAGSIGFKDGDGIDKSLWDLLQQIS